jgi:hypothetical protein
LGLRGHRLCCDRAIVISIVGTILNLILVPRKVVGF